MQSNSQAANSSVVQTTVEQSHPLIPQEWGPTVSTGSLAISILAVVLSGMALRNTRKTARQTSFDNHYGDSIRTGLRSLEEICGNLRAYAFPSKPLGELKKELEGVQAEIEETAFRIGNLIGEVDGASSIKRVDWREEFATQIDDAGSALESAAAEEVTTELELRNRIDTARKLYDEAIVQARTSLERVRKKA